MELNKEQIISSNNELYDYVKRIVAAVKYKGDGDHEDVPSILKKFAKGYEQKIFSLENRLKECENGYEGTLALERAKVKELTAENDSLEAAIVALKEEVKLTRADTVRKMAERLKRYYDANDRYLGYSIAYNIDLVAEAMLNGAAADNKCVACGDIIPEGRQVCPGCEGGGRDGKIKP